MILVPVVVRVGLSVWMVVVMTMVVNVVREGEEAEEAEEEDDWGQE